MLFRPPALHRRLARRTPRSPALLCALLLLTGLANANDPPPAPKSGVKKPTADITATSASSPKEVGDQLREALGTAVPGKKKLTIVVSGKAAGNGTPAPVSTRSTHTTSAQARAAALVGHGQTVQMAPAAHAADAHGGDVHWSYEGEAGPQAWGKLKPDFNVCALGKRQSPINIEDGNTLQGPAEPVKFNYAPSNGTVINNGHTIQVDVQGENSITVRGARYQLLQFHFHSPSEEQINGQRAAMVAHLVHKSDEGQLAVVAVLLQPGEANPMVDKVWTYMPLDAGDRVRMPRELLNLNELLPADQRYYQFMGSLTTPPCSEGVLWMVLKQPTSLSRSQLKLFTQLYPNNARPVQALNGRPVREAQ
ncbi:carbonic anhydrase [Rhodoferax sp. TS-BS-61-7]|uniref:carbonic anhydrase n=1 Tax=Rhodoferax sp. TS-BS-61-7 TaxID=2094194 RepID=UPI001374A136|nr:carbonic anhydrase family protein [Rhodoferax sp. TS-BS-61-7]